MTRPGDGPAWMTAWLEAQRELARFAAGSVAPLDPAGAEARHRLADYAQDYASLASAFWEQLQTGKPGLDALREPLIERYRQFFAPPDMAAGGGPPDRPGAKWLRWQRAAESCARQASAVAIDACERFHAALTATGPEAAPITSLRALHALWVECGEAAFAAAAHREDYVAAQSELLAALVELRAGADSR